MANVVDYRVFDEGYSVIKLNRPEKRNAVSNRMVIELKNCLNQAKEDSIKFLVLAAEGDETFCAGGDLQDLHGDLTVDEAFSKLYAMKQVLYDIASFPVPTICLLNGDALGGGCELATACDFRIAKEGSSFGFVQTKLGIIPGWGGGVLLYEKVDTSFAYQWLMEAEKFDTAYLKERGWLHRVVPKEEWHDQSFLLKPYLSRSYEQMKVLKSQYSKKLSMLGLSALMDDEVRNCAKLWNSDEHKNAVKKFFARS